MAELQDPRAGAGEIFLPGTYAEEYDTQAAQSYAAAMVFREWLKEIDVRLDIVWAKAGSTNLKAERWYIVRRNEDAPTTYWMVNDGTAEEGYADPGPEHIARLQQMDSARRPGAWHDYRKRCEEDERRGKKKREERFREMRERLDERIASISGSSIAVSPEMKAMADGHDVTESGVVLPIGTEAPAIAEHDTLIQQQPVSEADVDDATGAGGVDDFMVLEDVPGPNRQQRRAIEKLKGAKHGRAVLKAERQKAKRNKALTAKRDRLKD